MSGLDSTEYYLRRERQEQAQAEAATAHHIAAIHLYMAARYAALARASGASFKTPPVGIFSWPPRRAAPSQAA